MHATPSPARKPKVRATEWQATLPYRIGTCRSQYGAALSRSCPTRGDVRLFLHFGEYATAIFGLLWPTSMIAGTPEVRLQLNDGSLAKAKGRIETVSGVVDPVTGTVQIKALFRNPDRELLSGSIGNVILQNPKTDAVTIPMTATVELQDKIIAYRLKRTGGSRLFTVDRLNDGNRFIVKEATRSVTPLSPKAWDW